jgi:hypothetical protein
VSVPETYLFVKLTDPYDDEGTVAVRLDQIVAITPAYPGETTKRPIGAVVTLATVDNIIVTEKPAEVLDLMAKAFHAYHALGQS